MIENGVPSDIRPRVALAAQVRVLRGTDAETLAALNRSDAGHGPSAQNPALDSVLPV